MQMSQHFPALEHKRDCSLFCPKKETDVKTVLHGAQVSAWHERSFKLSDIYWKQSGKKKTGTRLNQFSSSMRLQFLHHGFNWTTSESWCWRNSMLSSAWEEHSWLSLSYTRRFVEEGFVGYICNIPSPTATELCIKHAGKKDHECINNFALL